jgi:hypothetical protein
VARGGCHHCSWRRRRPLSPPYALPLLAMVSLCWEPERHPGVFWPPVLHSLCSFVLTPRPHRGPRVRCGEPTQAQARHPRLRCAFFVLSWDFRLVRCWS